ncbi:MAG: hypothetical protein HQ559_18075, partial [Lentisphaerae bacterium]|nr:hypothetical protein [Lentisphaerota bacterium]
RIAINLPDPYRYQLRPLGLPSGVRIYAMTLERAPLQMQMTAAEPGGVFNEPQIPTFRLELINVLREHWIPYSIETVATADDGTVVRQVLTNDFHSMAWVYGSPIIHRTVSVPVPKRGHYALTLRLLARGTDVINTRETTFALLAPDTREYRDESPFGTWDFAGTHATAADPDLRGPLYVKAGLRYGMNEQPSAIRRKYGLLSGGDLRVRGTNSTLPVLAQMEKDPEMEAPARCLVFHEAGISGPHLTRTPDLFTGRPPYRMNADEEKTWEAVWAEAENATRAIREAFPQAETYFGNTTPHLLEEFLRRGWPPKDLGTIGNESGSFMRMPETQPLDFVSGNSAIWMLRRIADHYGAKDVPLRQCLEICYPGSNPGNLTERTQAAYLVRHNMHSLAWGIPVIRPMSLTDMGNSYYYSNWGGIGLCHAWPHVCPKPSYVAFAVLTQVLDGARFVRFVPTGSTVVYALEFRLRNKQYVTCLWTPRGTRPLTVSVSRTRRATLTDLMGRESEVAFAKGQAIVDVSSLPCYLRTDRPIATIEPGTPVHETEPAGDFFLISALDTLADWTIDAERSIELETYNFMNPRRKGNFVYREVAGNGGAKTVLEVEPTLPVEGSVYLQMYSSLALKQPKGLPGHPTEIGLRVDGNGSWGRIIFELEDASGQRWVSIGAE